MGMKKRIFLLLGIFVMIFIFIKFSGANFVCGEVNDSREYSSSWSNILVYYSENPQRVTNCKVSPANSKYCCDLEAIKEILWSAGKNVSAEIYDLSSGLVSMPVSLITSANGYDIFPMINVKNGINLNPELKRVYLNISALSINLSSALNYPNLHMEMYHNGILLKNESLCTNCNNGSIYLENLSRGEYRLIIRANGLREVSQENYFIITDYIYFKRSLECEGCTKNVIPRNKVINITLEIKFPFNVSGNLKEYFPSELNILDANKEPFDNTYNFLNWQMNGSEAVVKYSILSPNYFFWRKIYLYSGFENFFSEPEVYTLKGKMMLPISLFKTSIIDRSLKYNRKLYTASASEPLMLSPSTEPISLIAIYPKELVRGIYAYTHFEDKRKFEISSNLGNERLAYILLKIKIKKSQNLGGTPVIKDLLSGDEIVVEIEKEDKFYLYYTVKLKKFGKFEILF